MINTGLMYGGFYEIYMYDKSDSAGRENVHNRSLRKEAAPSLGRIYTLMGHL